jgi:hypothetical protein
MPTVRWRYGEIGCRPSFPTRSPVLAEEILVKDGWALSGVNGLSSDIAKPAANPLYPDRHRAHTSCKDSKLRFVLSPQEMAC